MFKTNSNVQGAAAVVELTGDLDTPASENFEADVIKLLKNNDDVMSLVLDMSGMDYICSSGLRKLLIVKRQISERGGAMSVQGVTPNVAQIFKITGFDQILGLK